MRHLFDQYSQPENRLTQKDFEDQHVLFQDDRGVYINKLF